MFIELTDHLRCPADHDESYLVLLPERMEGRWVRAGRLGCPICGRTYELVDGALDLGGAPAGPPARTRLEPEALTALVGLSGPGGYMVLVGAPGVRWHDVVALNPGVSLVAVNPGADTADEPGVSVLRGDSLPLKSRSMRGVVLGEPYGSDPRWVADAARIVLPGLRVAGEGPVPSAELIDLMASADGVWVGTPRR